MTARDMFFEFIETILIVIIFSFIIFYIILGDRLDIVNKIIIGLGPLSLFSLLFLIKEKINRRTIYCTSLICLVINRDKRLIFTLSVR